MNTIDVTTGALAPIGTSAGTTTAGGIFDQGAWLSAADLDERVTRLCSRLQAAGVRPGMLVGVHVPRSVDTVISILAVLKAGAAFLPVDPAHPADRTARILRDAQPCCLLIRSSCPFPFDGSTIEVDQSTTDPIPDDSASAPEPAPNSPAYVIYTSGTTGTPKGTVLTRRGLRNYTTALKALQIAKDDVYLWTASQAFSSSVRQLLLPLSHGASVVVATADDIADPVRLFRLIADRGITILDLVPSYWRMCTRVLEGLRERERAALLDNKVRLILSASEPLPSDLPRRWRDDFGYRGEFLNGYGHTETTGLVSLYWIPDQDLRRPEGVPIGPPLQGTTFDVLDEGGHQVPVGGIGELYMSGRSLALGYLHRPDLDAERFVPGPSGLPDDRRYRTGDLVQPLPDGTFRFIGRLDQQVKINGVRVEVEEIEAVLRDHPVVHDAAVALRDGDADHRCLVAFVVAADARDTTVGDLRTFLTTRLPQAMIPGEFRIVASLPRTVSGKIDRAQLKLTAVERVNPPGPRPTSGLEAEVAAVWGRILRLPEVDVAANFFELGGDSLKAMELVAILQQKFPTEAPMLALFFEEPTVAALAQAIQETLIQPVAPVTTTERRR